MVTISGHWWFSITPPWKYLPSAVTYFCQRSYNIGIMLRLLLVLSWRIAIVATFCIRKISCPWAHYSWMGRGNNRLVPHRENIPVLIKTSILCCDISFLATTTNLPVSLHTVHTTCALLLSGCSTNNTDLTSTLIFLELFDCT